jgi:hypothetical protein
MESRRNILAGLATALTVPLGASFAADLPKVLPPTGVLPDGKIHANLLPGAAHGDPPILDFGDGLRIPLGKSALKVLWEGKDFWITYGAGNASRTITALAHAKWSAVGTMKFLLLTLAFAPERVERFENCGWRLKSQDVKDFVMGDIDLPGEPPVPIATALGGRAQPGMDAMFNTMDFPVGSFGYNYAFTSYIVRKKDITLDDVRARAQLL